MKQHFRMPQGSYLLSHSVGCLPVASEHALARRYLKPWQELGGDAWAGWLAEIERFRGVVARLLGVRIDNVCPQANVSSAVTKILHGLPARHGRNRLLLCEEDFPSIGFVLKAASKVGYEPIFIPRGAAAEDLQTWQAALDDRTQLALITHAFSNRSARLPVQQITQIARERGVVTIVDATQTVGVVPINVADWSADFVVGSSVKFLCGGPGAGFLWMADSAMAMAEPVDTGWFSHEDPFAFDIHEFRPAANALRFWGGTPSIAPFVLASAAVELLLGIGVEAIYAHNQALISQLHDRVPSAVIASARPLNARANTVLLRIRDAERAQLALHKARIFADLRDGCVRVSPHLYNDLNDLECLVLALQPYF